MKRPALGRAASLLSVIAVACICGSGAFGQTYRFIPLVHPEGSFTATGMNDACMVVGTLTKPDNSTHAFIWHVSGRWVGLPEMAGNRSRAFGLNDLGHVGGWTIDGNGFGRAGVWRNGIFNEQSLPSGAVTVPIALDLNNKSEAVGYYRTTGSIPHAFFWDAQGNVTKLPELAGGSSIAYAINELSEIAGAATLQGGANRAVLWKKDAQTGNFQIQDLGSLGGDNSVAYDINNAGHVVGAAQTSPTTNHAFLWDGGPMLDLGTLSGTNSIASAINDSGIIAGRAQAASLAAGVLVMSPVRPELLHQEASVQGNPNGVPSGEVQPLAPNAADIDKAAKIIRDETGSRIWVDYNTRVPVDHAMPEELVRLDQAIAINLSRAALVKNVSGEYGILLPFRHRNVIMSCASGTGICPEIDGFGFSPYSGVITLTPGTVGPMNPPMRIRYTSRRDFEHGPDGFGPGWADEYGTHVAYFPSGYAEACHFSGQIDVFEDRNDRSDSWLQMSNCRQDQLGVTQRARAGTGDLPLPVAPATQPQFVLYRESEGLFHFFDDNGLLSAIEDANGNRRSLTRSGDRLEGVSDNLGNSITYSYGSSGRVSQVSEGTRTYRFAYTGGYLTSMTDPLGHVTSFDYDDAHPIPGLLSAVTLPRGNTRHQFEYDDDGRLVRVTSATGGVWTITYEGFETEGVPYPYRNRRTEITDPLGHTTAYVYDREGRLLEAVDQSGSSITYGYDNFGLRASITDRLGGQSQIVHDPASLRPERVREADGMSRSYAFSTWTAHGLAIPLLSTISYPSGGGETYTYDGKGNLLSFRDRGGNVWTYTYDAIGQVLTATNPLGGTTGYDFGPNGLLTTITDDAGNTTTLEYDGLDRLIGVQGADGTRTKWTYDLMDRLLAATDENGGKQEFAYDENGNLIGFTDAMGNKSTFGYDALDRLVTFTDARGAISTISYDALSRPVQATDANGNSVAAAYDATGRPQSVTDAGGNSWQFNFDAEGIIASTADPAGRVTSFTSDRLGRTTAITSGGTTTSLTRDNLGQLTGVVGPDGWATTRQLNDLGRPDQIALPNGAFALYAFDAAGQLTQAVDPGGGAWTQARDAQGRLASSGDPVGGSHLYAHDNMNRLAQVSFPGGMGSMTVSYHPVGTVGTHTYTDGTSLAFTHDPEQRLTATDGAAFSYDANGAMTQSNGIAIARDPGGRITSMALAPGRTISYQYNSRNLVTRVEDWMGTVVRLDYDAAGRLVAISRPNGVDTERSYNPEGRLASVLEGVMSSILLTYDIQGRISMAQRNTPVAADSLPQSSRALAFDAAARVSSFTYDAMGRLLSDGSRTFVWDLASRLKSYVTGGGTVMCTYDGLGNRITRSEGGVTHSFVWNYALDLPSVSVVRFGGADLRYYVHTPDGMLLYSIEASDGDRRFYHFDEAGNTVAVTGTHGDVLAAYAYSPFGAILASSGALANPFTFGGLFGVYQEGSTGLFYMRARYFDSGTGRFVSRDPVQSFSPEQLNPYQYALGNPLRHADPTGMWPFPLPPSPQGPAPLRPQSDFTSRDEFLRHYNDWSEQMQRWLKEVEARDRLIDEGGRPGSYEEWGWTAVVDTFGVREWRPPQSRAEAWQDYIRAVNETNSIVLRLELLSRGHWVSLRTARGVYNAGITSVEQFEDHLAKGRAAAMAVHNQAVAASTATALALLASQREAAKPCPVAVGPVPAQEDRGDAGPGGMRLLTHERKQIKDSLGKLKWLLSGDWMR